MTKCKILSSQVCNDIELLDEPIAIYLYEKQHRQTLIRKSLKRNSTKDYEYLRGTAITAIKESTRAGLLRGQVPPQKLGRQMYSVLRLAYIEWARGEIGFDDFRQEVLSGTYLCLAADAHPKFHRALIHKYNTLSLGPYEVSKK